MKSLQQAIFTICLTFQATAQSQQEGTPYLLSGNSTTVESFDITTNSEFVVMHDGGLKVAPTNGSAAIRRLSPVDTTVVNDYQLTTNDEYVVFRAAHESSKHCSELFAAKILNGLIHKVTGNQTEPICILSFKVSPDGNRIIYQTNASGIPGIYSTPTEGGAITQLNLPFPIDRPIGLIYFEISPDSTKVTYLAEQTGFNIAEFFVTSIDGGLVTKLHGDLNELVPGFGAAQGSPLFSFTPDSQNVVFMANKRDIHNLYISSVTAPNPQRVGPSRVGNRTFRGWKYSPDGKYLIQGFDRKNIVGVGFGLQKDLTLISLENPGDFFFIGDLVPYENFYISSYDISEDSQFVAFSTTINASLFGYGGRDVIHLFDTSSNTLKPIPSAFQQTSGTWDFHFNEHLNSLISIANLGNIYSTVLGQNDATQLNSTGKTFNGGRPFKVILATDPNRIIYPSGALGSRPVYMSKVEGSEPSIALRGAALAAPPPSQDFKTSNDQDFFVFRDGGQVFAVKGWSELRVTPTIAPIIYCLLTDECEFPNEANDH